LILAIYLSVGCFLAAEKPFAQTIAVVFRLLQVIRFKDDKDCHA